ncbi:polysaccharide pyruvyl transferase family protein [Bacteroides sp. 519]|uniref:polysaccharide pyruvyl transferase family protein n=1 Tax=Bacteroides sp. 519 TaxID=2302937 RepID=UPI0013D3BC04|nr:polysaccharide pyruvyl transferase family protein [Bacteroides sp. 519]NDV57784.1 polysaccharide pyruvyl transferase family protein [Bacteroides sp. 519]
MIKLYHFSNNFGDSASPYIIEKLSEEKVSFAWPFTNSIFIHHILSSVKHIFRWSFKQHSYNLAFTRKRVLIAVGSLIEGSTPRCIVWGTGIAQSQNSIKGGRFIFTRGKLSTKLLRSKGFDVEYDGGGDPALLFPLIYHPIQLKQKYKIGIICHNSDSSFIPSHKLPLSSFVINLNTNDVEKVIDEICNCEIIFSSSLHGLIVSHAYGIPAVWIEREQLVGGRFKFYDYFSSVDIKDYEPINFYEVFDKGFKVDLSGKQLNINSNVLNQIQQVILRHAPFEIKNTSIVNHNKNHSE